MDHLQKASLYVYLLCTAFEAKLEQDRPNLYKIDYSFIFRAPT